MLYEDTDNGTPGEPCGVMTTDPKETGYLKEHVWYDTSFDEEDIASARPRIKRSKQITSRCYPPYLRDSAFAEYCYETRALVSKGPSQDHFLTSHYRVQCLFPRMLSHSKADRLNKSYS